MDPNATPAPAAPAAQAPTGGQPTPPAAEPQAQEGTLIGGSGEPVIPPNVEGQPAEPPAVPTGAPESYSDFTLPEGVGMDPEFTDSFKSLSKELNLSQEQAQKLMDLGAGHIHKASQEVMAQLGTQFQTMRTEWRNELSSNAEFGGAKTQETVTRAKRVLGEYFDPKFSEFLGEGLGDNAKLIIGLAKIDAALGERRVPTGLPPAGKEPKTPGVGMYKNSNMVQA